ncbi:MAG: double-strand break repair helicase AddA [Sphingobium phenoxybenzoativorans]
MSKPSPLQPLAGDQALASGPDAHVWLSASAGTGKTHVLTARVYRLLLGGVPPENILCLTFTKAGAAEMAERIHNRLAQWVQMDEAALFEDLEALGEDSGPLAREKARRLFAEVLEATGGGLRIQTIHSFCQQLLAAFPLEADLVPGFRPLEERERMLLARQALADMIVEAEARDDTPLIEGLQALSLRLGEGAAENFLMRCARRQDVMQSLPADLRGWLFQTLDLPEGDIEAHIAEACSDDAFDMAALSRIAAANAAWGTATGIGFAERIGTWRGADTMSRAALLEDLKGVFLTGKDEPRKASAKQIAAEPAYADLAARLGARCAELVALRIRAAYAAMLGQALHAGRAYAGAYAEAKRHAGAVDFDDLIARAAALLLEPGMGDWIRYKLDQRTDHILVDEAQDTNVVQWDIVEALAAEFFAGEGAKGDMIRTIFTVGDFKQAIFGFQGTSPQAFERARQRFQVFAASVDHPFHDLSLDRSFRSTPAVLDVVDATLDVLTKEGLGLPDVPSRHVSANPYPGEVMLWKPVAAGPVAEEEAEGAEDWLADQERALAAKIAAQIAQWLRDGVMLESKGRPVGPGDIMILVRRRSDLARLIVARLYEERVNVAGIDRLRLNAPLAVRDLLAALRFAVQPEDDLNLANLLVSPLIGWSQDDLLARAAPRRDGLWTYLRATLGDSPLLDPLRVLLGQADLMTPYRYLERILSGPMQGRRKLLHRLGAEAADPIEELLNAALAFESDGQPSLQRFIDWFDRGEVDIVRDAAAQGDAVRLLTVHGAKGLQAPIVILADAAHDPEAGNRSDALEWEGLPLISPRKAERAGPIGAAAETAARDDRQEHGRLLYVALTRAEEKLVVTGSLGPRCKGVVPETSWFSAVDRAMQGLGADWDADPLWGAVRHWRGREALPPHKPEPKESVTRQDMAEPAWLRTPAPVEARPPRPLAPSAPVDDDTPDPPPSPAMRAAADRGKWLHALFERLPAIAPADRRAAADRWLESVARLADPDDRSRIIDHALGIIEEPRFAALFSPEALAEAPIAAVVGEDVIAGTVDRLCIGPDSIQVVDFKTGGRFPETAEGVPVPHLRQMAAYVAALEAIFPGRTVEAALLYTAGPALIGLPPAVLTPHKPGFSPEQHNL